MSKTIKIVMATLLLVLSLGLSFGAGCTVGTSTATGLDLGLDVVEEAWGIIFQDYVDKSRLDAGVLSGAAIKGMVEAIDDPYTAYLEVEAYKMSVESLEGKYEGIGAYVGFENEQVVIIAPITGSPAAKAGIQAGDIILAVDGIPTSGMSVQEVVPYIRGPKGAPVLLLILHQGETEPEEIEVVRDEVEVSSVHFEMMEDIAYININHFTERTDGELSSALESMNQEGATGIVLDLRRNPGGLLDVVIDVAGHFLDEGVVTSVVNNRGEQTSLSVEPGGIFTDLPVVVLSDNYSASGSEVLAGALQDHARATIAGAQTYGKGSVNTLNRLQDGSGLYITTARWLTPDGHMIEGEGISPDHELDLKEVDAIQWAIDYLESNT
ncbi:S41 family peptidase [Chloroflexota bacterium]